MSHLFDIKKLSETMQKYCQLNTQEKTQKFELKYTSDFLQQIAFKCENIW